MSLLVKQFTTASGLGEAHAIVTPDATLPFADQLAEVGKAVDSLESDGFTPILIRYFLSDPANQASAVESLPRRCAVSLTGQPPLCGAKVCAWIWAQQGVKTEFTDCGDLRVDHGSYHALIRTNDCRPAMNAHDATKEMLLSLAASLPSLALNCVRTWLLVRDVDVNYSGVVSGRNEAFRIEGLNDHYIASTGINATAADPTVRLTLDALSYVGIDPQAIRFLTAPAHLNPTREYGVAFERATAVDFPDGRRHVYVSGTASINNKGEIVYPGNVELQTGRMIENVEALLAEADCTFADAAHMIVYLRDTADYATVSRIFAERFPEIPTVILLAPVCRPGWLIEMEVMAIR